MTTERTKTSQEKFLASYAATGNVSHAARATGVSRGTHYAWLADEFYEAKFADAKAEAVDVMAYECYRRAVLGTDEKVFFQGIEVGVQRRYSDNLLMFLLKAADPAKYRDNVRNESDDELNKQIAARLAAMIAKG